MDRANTIETNPDHLRLESGRFFTVPNVLTIVRILLTPVFLGLIFSHTWYNKILALIVFTVASLTDFYDGKIARRDGTITSFGRFMDPLADKLLVSSALISFWWLGMVEPRLFFSAIRIGSRNGKEGGGSGGISNRRKQIRA